MKIEKASIITVRNSSKRLPNKAILKIKNDITAVEVIIERAKKIGFPVILATSIDNSDDILFKLGKKHRIEVFRGSLLNKIKRWNDCFNKYEIKEALLIDGDDLCYDYDIGIRAMNQLNSTNNDVIMCPKNIITGLFTLAVNSNAIQKLYEVVPENKKDTDLFMHYFEKINLKKEYVDLRINEKNKKIRLTLDYKEDFDLFKKIYEKMNIDDNSTKIIDYLEKNESIVKINYHKEKDFLENKENGI